jgi:nitroreductase
MRRVRPDPIPEEVQARILDAAVRAPSGGNTQGWRFLLVDDPDLRSQLGPIYRDCVDQLWSGFYATRIAAAEADPGSEESRQFQRIRASADHLGDHFAEVPLLLFGFVQYDPTGGSIFPAIWSAQLAARAEGVGSSLTSVLQFRSAEVLSVLGVPDGEGWLMACCVTFGYPTGRWGVAARRPAHEVTYRNRWGADAGFRVDEPLWPPAG